LVEELLNFEADHINLFNQAGNFLKQGDFLDASLIRSNKGCPSPNSFYLWSETINSG
jgi:hypothetical protein